MTAQVAAWLHTLSWREVLTSAVDIAAVYYVVYRALLLVRGTRAAQMLAGLLLVGGAFFVARLFELSTLLWLIDNFINYSIIFLIVIFQHDIRRGLRSVGSNLAGWSRPSEAREVYEEVVQAAEQLARARIGALVVFEREAALDDLLREGGVPIEAEVRSELLVALFIPSPHNALHDGAVIIRNLRLHRAGCVLPLSSSVRLDKSHGTRHRAGVGITEDTDAVALVVSEERGTLSLCVGGAIRPDLDGAALREELGALLGGRFRLRRPTSPGVKSGSTGPTLRASGS